MNQHMRLWASAAIIACVILIGFILSTPHTRDIPDRASPNTTVSAPEVTLHDSFKKGVHTISGSIQAPTPCTSVTASASLIGAGSSSESILVEVSLSEDSGVCLKRQTTASFSMTITAAASAPIQATVNGAEATTTS